jgi:hypothetical protein
VRLTRVLIGIAASVAACLLVMAGPAGAKTVYQYEYSGSFFDGAGSTKGQFTGNLGGIDYDPATESLYLGLPSTPTAIGKFSKTGTPLNFSALNNGAGRDYIDLGQSVGGNEISVDRSGAASAGNLYLSGVGFSSQPFFGYHPNGLPISPAFDNENNGLPGITLFGGCGLAAGPSGELFTFTDGNGTSLLQERSLTDFAVQKTFLSEVTFSEPELCGLKIDSQRNFYGLWAGGGFNAGNEAIKEPPEPVANGIGMPDKELRYRLNAACCGTTVTNQHDSAGRLAIDTSNDEVFVSENKTPFPNQRISVYDSKGGLLGTFGEPGGGYEGLVGVGGITVDPVTHDVYVANNRAYPGEIRHVEKFVRGPSSVVPDTDTEAATQPEDPTKGVLHGTLDPDGITPIYCYFEYGATQSLGSFTPCNEGLELTPSGEMEVSADVAGLTKGKKYWFKLFSLNTANEIVSDGGPEFFTAQAPPTFKNVFADGVNTDGFRVSGTVDPNGGRTSYHLQYGPTTEYGFTTPSKRIRREETNGEELVESLTDLFELKELITGLESGTQYHFRVVAENEQGSATSADQEIITYVQEPESNCPNQLARQQTGSAKLLDCRAYELASTDYSGGNDVVSSTVPGSEPLVAYPGASGKLLYSLDSAIVPGTLGDPTNLGRDPYVAVRGANGWTTRYVGLPSGGMEDTGMFGSPLLEADSAMEQFAFGGEDICDPCFEDGSTNVPLRRSNGSLEKGMAGSLSPAADPAGEVRKRFSADGSSFIFGADKKFESTGNEGSVSIYERDLQSGTTQVVSTMPNGATMTGAGIAGLDVSADGSRVLVGKEVGKDAGGNSLYHLYMHIGNSKGTYDLTPGTTTGVLFNGMTADGSKVFFSTKDPILTSSNQDTDTSVDLFRTTVDPNATVTVERVSTGSGGTGNTDACEPIADWNVLTGGPDCSVVPIPAGSGVAADDGTVYFVSPELLDGTENAGEPDNQPTLKEANLYAAKPGQAPKFVALLDSSLVKAGPAPPKHPVVNNSFATALGNPESIAVDQNTGDVYVLERSLPRGVRRFDSEGNPKEFTAGPGEGTNKVPVNFFSGTAEAQVAFDSSGGTFDGSFYVTSTGGSIVLFAGNGEELGTIGGFNFQCGVAVDQSSGVVYVGDYSYGGIWRLEPTSGATPVTAANYSVTSIHTQGMSPCQVAADTAGNVYASQWANGPTKRFAASDFEAGAPSKAGVSVASVSSGLMTDPETDELYVDERSQISIYDTEGNNVQTFGSSETLGTNSRGVAVNAATKHVYATNGSNVLEFGTEVEPYLPIDNPVIVHGLDSPATHRYDDFQVTPDGRYAVFSTVVPLTGYTNLGHYQIYRYDLDSDEVACASCAPTNQPSQSDVKLTPFGLNLTDDGRVFFTTQESYALRDTNGKSDAYEWSSGRTELVSAGLGPAPSALLSVTADGKDAFFFTRDILSRLDSNGNAIKVYDAREGGGFVVENLTKPCAASDECHGAGTEQPGPPAINTATGEGTQRQVGEGNDRCKALRRKARENSNRAKQLRRKAKKASSAKQKRKLNKRARRATQQASKLSRKAKACSRSSRGGNK